MQSPTWYPVAWSSALRTSPLAVTLAGRRLVVFRDAQGTPVALEDRCPHRGVSLSLGKVRGGTIACAYHGWRFDGAGACVEVPSATAADPAPKCRVPSFPCLERQGTLWVSSESVAPSDVPAWPCYDEPGYSFLDMVTPIECPPIWVLQNLVDCAHTGVLHRGLFRGDERREIRARVERTPGQVAVENFGEANAKSLVMQILSPGGRGIRHTDTYRAPSTVEVNYWWGKRHLVTTTICVPAAEGATVMFTRLGMSFGVLTPLLIRALRPATRKILDQDRVILEDQARNLARDGKSPLASTVSDLPCLWIEQVHAKKGEEPETERVREIKYRL